MAGNGVGDLGLQETREMPTKARVTLELSEEELQQLFTLAAKADMTELAFALGRSASALRANLNRLQTQYKESMASHKS